MSEIFAVQLTAVATLALAVFALTTAGLAYAAWRKQSREVSDQSEMLALQAEELRQAWAEREREARERRRAQASCIYITITRSGRVSVRVVNTSDLPVYDLVIDWRKGAAVWDKATGIGVLPPKDETTVTRHIPGDLPERLFDANVRFRDAAGVHWSLRPDGRLTERRRKGSFLPGQMPQSGRDGMA